MKILKKYFLIDLKRGILSSRCLFSIFLVIIVFWVFTLEEAPFTEEYVVRIFSSVINSGAFLVGLSCGAVAFASSLCEDVERKYLTQQIIRGGIKPYVTARVSSIFIITSLVVCTGVFVYAISLRMVFPWILESAVESGYYEVLLNGRLSVVAEAGNYPIYYLLYAAQHSLLSGNLAIWAAYISLFIQNRMIVMSSPMLLFYLLDSLTIQLFPEFLGVYNIFSPEISLFDNDLKSFALIILISSINICILKVLTERRIRRKYSE